LNGKIDVFSLGVIAIRLLFNDSKSNNLTDLNNKGKLIGEYLEKVDDKKLRIILEKMTA
jgi:hypothetical protein